MHTTRRALLLALVSFLAPVAAAGAGKVSTAIDQAYADTALADDFLTAITGGAQGLPLSMDAVNAAQIVHKLLTGKTEEAISLAVGFLKSKGVALAGTGASGLVAAVSAGEALGMKAHELFGDQKLKAIYAGLARDIPKLSTWPATYPEAQQDDFVSAHLTRLHVVANWLKAKSGESGSDLDFQHKAYQALVAMRDFEMGCDTYGLKGNERTPEKLREAALRDLEVKAARAKGARDARLFMLEVARAAEAVQEKERLAREMRRAEEEAQRAKQGEEARRLAEGRLRLEREAAEARARLAGEEGQLREMQARLAPKGKAPPAAGAQGLKVSVRSESQGPDATLFRVTVTNGTGAVIEAFKPDVRAAREVSGGGVAWSGGQEPRTLRPGQTIEMTCLGTGDIGAAVLYLAGGGRILTTQSLPVSHKPAPAAAPSVSGLPPWLELPSRYRGRVTFRVTARIKGGASLETISVWEQSSSFDKNSSQATIEAHSLQDCGLFPTVEKLPNGGTRVTGYHLEKTPAREAKQSATRLPLSFVDGKVPAPALPPDSPVSRVRWTRWDGDMNAERILVRHTLVTTFPARGDLDPPKPEWSLEQSFDGTLTRVR